MTEDKKLKARAGTIMKINRKERLKTAQTQELRNQTDSFTDKFFSYV